MVILKIFFGVGIQPSWIYEGDPPFYIHMPYRLDKSRSAKSSHVTKNQVVHEQKFKDPLSSTCSNEKV